MFEHRDARVDISLVLQVDFMVLYGKFEDGSWGQEMYLARLASADEEEMWKVASWEVWIGLWWCGRWS